MDREAVKWLGGVVVATWRGVMGVGARVRAAAGSAWGQAIEFLILKVLARLFPRRYRLIPRAQDGAPLLRQFRLFDWLFLQSFVNPELREFFHVHRFRRMISIVLCGAFMEERYPGGGAGSYPRGFYLQHSAPSIYMMDGTTLHRLEGVRPRTWTLFFQFGDRAEWGYFPRPANVDYVPWDKFIPTERRVPPLVMS